MDEITGFLVKLTSLVFALASLLTALAANRKALREFFFGKKKDSDESPNPPTRPQKEKRRRLVVTIISLSLFIAFLGAFVFTARLPPPPPPTREVLLARAWNAHNGEKWGGVVELTTKLLKDFEYPADIKQTELTKLKAPLPKPGRVGVDLSDADVQNNHSFGLINDVATALFLRGEGYIHLGKEVEARADWKKVMTFEHAVTYDLQTKEFWRTKEGAENKLFQLDRKK